MAVSPAPTRLSRRTLERQGMTPEQELELLIAEQQADDTFYVDRRPGEVSLDAPSPSGDGTVGSEMVGYDPWDLVDAVIDAGLDPAEVAYRGPLVSHLQPRKGDLLTDPTKVKHGTRHAYTRKGCRCTRCREANASYIRELRAARRAEQ